MKLLSYAVSGAIFAIGLAVAGMTQPSKVVGFLDFFGDWDPSLGLVMGGAILVHLIGYRLITKRRSPVFADVFRVPTRTDIDFKLLAGSALFGIGWGLGGYCPGPALTSLVTLEQNTIIFGASMLGTMLGYSLLTGKTSGAIQVKKTQAAQ